MRENNLYPFGGDPVRKRNRNPATGKGMKTGMGMRMYTTGKRNKLCVDALTSRRTVFSIARFHVALLRNLRLRLFVRKVRTPLFSDEFSTFFWSFVLKWQLVRRSATIL